MYDVAIIGGGIIGCAVARCLSRYNLKAVLLEKENDIAMGTTRANSAIVHAGFDAKPGTYKSRFNVLGNSMFESLCSELDVPFKKIGSLVLAFNEDEVNTLLKLYNQGMINCVPSLEILNREELLKIEPNLGDEVLAALHAPTGGIVGPWELAIAMAENAAENGVEFRLSSCVTEINRIERIEAEKAEKSEKTENGFHIRTSRGEVDARLVVNCSGVYADMVNDMVCAHSFEIHPRKGEYDVFDKCAGKLVNHVIFQCPTEKGKGALVTPTVHGNLMIGPNAEDISDKEDVSTTPSGLDFIRKTAARSVKGIPHSVTITNFAGLRARSGREDFIIEEAADINGFFNVAGIESPGLTAAPAIAEFITSMLLKKLGNPAPKKDYCGKRSHIVFHELSDDEKNDLIRENPLYGRVICRCEWITEGEIVDCIRGNVGATTVDGVKRRVRPGTGRCQGGFCGPRVMEILARELGIDLLDIIKDRKGSSILTGETKAEVQNANL